MKHENITIVLNAGKTSPFQFTVLLNCQDSVSFLIQIISNTINNMFELL